MIFCCTQHFVMSEVKRRMPLHVVRAVGRTRIMTDGPSRCMVCITKYDPRGPVALAASAFWKTDRLYTLTVRHGQAAKADIDGCTWRLSELDGTVTFERLTDPVKPVPKPKKGIHYCTGLCVGDELHLKLIQECEKVVYVPMNDFNWMMPRSSK
jgi:hypothetical protein